MNKKRWLALGIAAVIFFASILTNSISLLASDEASMSELLAADEEVIEDGHPILIVSASDIAQILRNNSIMSNDIDEWLESIDNMDRKAIQRISYYHGNL